MRLRDIDRVVVRFIIYIFALGENGGCLQLDTLTVEGVRDRIQCSSYSFSDLLTTVISKDE